jgi:hypothetical protein
MNIGYILYVCIHGSSAQVAEDARRNRKRKLARVIQKGGIITIGNARKKAIRTQGWAQPKYFKYMTSRYNALLVRDKRRWQSILEEFMEFTEDPY